MNTISFHLFLSFIISIFSMSTFYVHAQEAAMTSDSYQLIKISNSRAQWKWDATTENKIIDLLDVSEMLDKEADTSLLVKQYIGELTEGFSKSIYIRNIIQQDDTVYFSRYWTKRDSVLNIVRFEKLGAFSDLNEFLGPIASIPTTSYGHAEFNFHYKGETLSFRGSALKSIWSLRTIYWTSANVFLPLGEADAIDIAVIDLGLPINYMEDTGTFVMIPKRK